MNIIELAKKAGFVEYELDDGTTEAFDKRYAKFAALVVANIDPKSFMSWQEGYEAGKQNEREECAKLCDEIGKESLSQWPYRFANMIRARGEA